MRRTVLLAVGAFVALASVSSTVLAADLPQRPIYKAPLYNPAPVFSWTGFYVGAHAGYGWSHFTGADPTGLGGGDADAKGFLGGAQLGYNYQFSNFVVGLEGEYSFSNVKIETPLFGGTLSLKNDYFITAAARLGYAFDRALLYVKGGAAWTRDKWAGNDGIGGTVSGNFNRHGWLLGAGLEYALWNNWSAKLEYDYMRFGSITELLTATGTLAVTGPVDVKLRTQMIKLGFNYRFNWLN